MHISFFQDRDLVFNAGVTRTLIVSTPRTPRCWLFGRHGAEIRADRVQVVSRDWLKKLFHALRALFAFLQARGSWAGRIKLHGAQDRNGLRQALASELKVTT